MTISTLSDMCRRRHKRRTALVAALLATVVAACSGEPTADPSPAGTDHVSGVPTTAPALEEDAQVAPEAGAPVTTARARSTSATARRASGPRSDRSPAAADGTASSPATSGGGEASAGPSSSATPDVPPFPPDDERIGITDSTIKLCLHANGQASDAVGAGKDDARVYWNWRNDQGGIQGRKVELVVTDDGDGTKVAGAYDGCRGSFLLLGGPTQDAIPAMREIVEKDPHPMPYLHFMARSDPAKRYSYSWYPTQEEYGRLAAEFVLAKHPNKKIGILRRDTPNWTPGYQSFVATLRANGVKPVAELAHPPQEQLYDAYLTELDAKGAEVVWAWNHALEHIPMLKQAKTRRFEFQWVLGFPVAAVSETLREDILDPPVSGLAVFPSFAPGLYDAHHARYEEQGRLYEAAYRKYRGQPVNGVLGDLLFHQWLESRQVAALLEQCGRDCTRTKLVHTLLTTMRHLEPKCPFDFSVGRAAGKAVHAVEAYRPSAGAVAWRETLHCATSF